MDALGCIESSCITPNTLLDLWLHAARQDPDTFVTVEESFFSLNGSKTLQKYHLGVNIYKMMIVDSFLQQQKPALIAAVIDDTYILSQEVFTTSTINLTNLCNKLLIPPLLWNPPFYLLPTLPPKFTPPSINAETSTYFTHYGTTLLHVTNCLRELSLHHIETPGKSTASPTEMDGPPPLLPPFSRQKNLSPFPSAIPTIHHTLQDYSIPVPPNACILSPLHETFDAILSSKNILEESMSMYHCFEISRSIPLPNIATNFLLKCVPIHVEFLSTHSSSIYASGSSCWYSTLTTTPPSSHSKAYPSYNTRQQPVI